MGQQSCAPGVVEGAPPMSVVKVAEPREQNEI